VGDQEEADPNESPKEEKLGPKPPKPPPNPPKLPNARGGMGMRMICGGGACWGAAGGACPPMGKGIGMGKGTRGEEGED